MKTTLFLLLLLTVCLAKKHRKDFVASSPSYLYALDKPYYDGQPSTSANILMS